MRHAAPGTARCRLAGLPDDAFEHDGQLTKCARDPGGLGAAGETLWDIGAGCGSIAIEWLRACRAARRSRSSATRRAPRSSPATPLHSACRDCASSPAARPGAGRPAGRRDLCRRRHRRPALAAGAVAGAAAGGRLVANVVTARARRGPRLAGAAGGALTRSPQPLREPRAHHAWRPLLPVTQLAATKPG